MLESLFIGCEAAIQNVARGEGNDWAGKLEQITPGSRSSLGLGQTVPQSLSSGFCKIAQIARREAGPDQTGAVQGWVRSGLDKTCGRFRDG